MKVELVTKKGKLQLDGAALQVKVKDHQVVHLRAQMDEGDSPVEIVMQGSNEPIPIRRFEVVDSRRFRVESFSYMRNKKRVTVNAFYRRVPLRYKRSGKVAGQNA